MTNHYLISLQIAKVLGYGINNPNEEEGVYYLNGTDVFGEAGFMKYNLAELQRRLVRCLVSEILWLRLLLFTKRKIDVCKYSYGCQYEFAP
jgi:hypothetical protein